MSPLGLMLTLAAAAQPLSLEEVVGSTAEHHPLVVAALADADAATGEELAARGAFDPAFRANAIAMPLGGYPSFRGSALVDVPTPAWGTRFQAGYRLGLGEFPDYYGERATNAGGELSASATVPLLRDGPTDRRRANIERARLGVLLARASVDQQRLELRRQAALRWVRWVTAGQRLTLAQQLLSLARARQTQLEGRVASGDLAAIDVLDNERAILQRRSTEVAARRGFEEASFELSLFLRDGSGRPTLAPHERVPAELSAPVEKDASQAHALALERRPELKRFAALQAQAEVEVSLAKNQLLPALDVQLGVSQDLGAGDAKRGRTEVEAGLRLEVPLWYRQLLGRRDAARAARTRAEAQARLQAERIAVEVSDALSALAAAFERSTLISDELKVTRRLEAAERERVDLGDSNLFLLNLRESATFEAALRELEARADWHRADADLKAALAAP